MDGKVAPVHPEFDNEQVRYEHRFAPFACLLTPPPVQYVEFRDAYAMLRCETEPPSIQMYIEGCKLFHSARNLLESLSNPDQEVGCFLAFLCKKIIIAKNHYE